VASSPRRTIVAWTLYDFANSAFAAIVVTAVFPPYYADLVVGNAEGLGDRWWGRIVSVSMVLVALASPVLGGIADHAGARKPFLVGFTLLAVAVTALMATVGPGMVLWGFAVAVTGVVAAEAAFVFYNSYLPRIAPASALGRVSAAGFAVGYAGSLVAFLVALPFARAEAYWACFLTAAVQFGVVAVPAFVWLPGDQRQAVALSTAVMRGVRETATTLREIVGQRVHRQLRWFLLAYFVYEDGVNTVITVSGVFARTTLGFSFQDLILLFLVVQITALLGSLAWAPATDRLGPRLVVRVTLVQWIAVTTLAYFVATQWHFWLLAILAGTGLGAIQAASRTFMATLIPAGREAEFFGFYSLVGKTGAIMGPLVFGEISAAMGGNQRIAIFAVGAFFVVGLALLARVRAGGPTATLEPRPSPEPKERI
jgi:MFS transporter, UMF1 family